MSGVSFWRNVAPEIAPHELALLGSEFRLVDDVDTHRRQLFQEMLIDPLKDFLLAQDDVFDLGDDRTGIVAEKFLALFSQSRQPMQRGHSNPEKLVLVRRVNA